jgi:hypothetical protein
MDYEALDGALMVLVGEDDYGEVIIFSWHGGDTLQVHDDTLQSYESKSYANGIADAARARVLAKEWLAEIIVANELAMEDDGA